MYKNYAKVLYFCIKKIGKFTLGTDPIKKQGQVPLLISSR